MNIVKPCKLVALFLGMSSFASAQGVHTLTLDETIRRVITTYPSVKQAEEAVKSARYNIKMAQAVMLPILSASASYTRIEPVATVHFEELDLSFDPKNNYNAGVSLRQMIYDFGKNRPIIQAAKEKEALSRLQQEELYQTLALHTVQIYYMNCFTRQAIQIKKQELSDYEEMLRQTEIRTNSGSTTAFDLLNTQVSQSAVSTQLTELTTNLRTLQVQLSILADTTVTETMPLNETFEITENISTLDDLLTTAYTARPEMQQMEKQISIARLEESAARRSFNPSLDLSAAAGGKNGYPIHLDKMKMNYEVGVTLSIPLYEGGRRKQSASLARSVHNSAIFQKELVEKQVKQEVSQNYNMLMSDSEKIKQLSRQVTLAQKACEQAKVNYKAGSITNLELLTSSTNLSGSQLQLLQAKINYLVNYYKLQVSIGEQIWQPAISSNLN